MSFQSISLTNLDAVLKALIWGKPIVTVDYWRAYVNSVRAQSQELPSPDRFSPVISESFLVNDPSLLKVNLNRRRLFGGKTFVFMSQRQMSKFRDLVTEAGGNSISLDSARFDKKNLLKKDNIPVQYVSSSQSQASEDIARLLRFLAEHGRRAVAEDEIGLAIFHGSILQFCNPDRSFKSNFEVSTIDLTDDIAPIAETPGNGIGLSESNLFIKETINLIDQDTPQPTESGADDSHEFENNPFDFADAEPLAVDARLPSASSKRKTEELEDASNAPEKRRKIGGERPSSEKLLSPTYSQNIGFIRTDNYDRSQSLAADSSDQSSTSNRSDSRDRRNVKRKRVDENSDDFEFDFGPLVKSKRKTSSLQPARSSARKEKDYDSDDEEFRFTLPQEVSTSSKSSQSTLKSKDSNGTAGQSPLPSAEQSVEVKREEMTFIDVTRSTVKGFMRPSVIEAKTIDSIASLRKNFSNLYSSCQVVDEGEVSKDSIDGNESVVDNNSKTFRKVIELIILNINRCNSSHNFSISEFLSSVC